MKKIWNLLKATFQEFKDDKVPRLAASLSYYTALAIAPLLVLLVTIIGWFLGNSGAQDQIIGQLAATAGPDAASVAESVLASAEQPNLARTAGILSLLILFWGASNVFAQLQESLNTIWDVEPKPDLGFLHTAKDRLLSFGMILVIGFLLLISLVLSTALSAIGSAFSGLLPGADWIWQIVELAVSFGVITLLFALIYRVLPDVKIAWRDVWMGALVTAVLFVIGKYALSFYLSFQSTSSAYGAAGSLVVFLIWIYYSAQIFFFGAEFTQVYARLYGEGVVPDSKAQYIGEGEPKKPPVVGPHRDKPRPGYTQGGIQPYPGAQQPGARPVMTTQDRAIVTNEQTNGHHNGTEQKLSVPARLMTFLGAYLVARRTAKNEPRDSR